MLRAAMAKFSSTCAPSMISARFQARFLICLASARSWAVHRSGLEHDKVALGGLGRQRVLEAQLAEFLVRS